MMMIVCFVSSALYRKGLVYLDCPINDDDCIIGKSIYHCSREQIELHSNKKKLRDMQADLPILLFA